MIWFSHMRSLARSCLRPWHTRGDTRCVDETQTDASPARRGRPVAMPSRAGRARRGRARGHGHGLCRSVTLAVLAPDIGIFAPSDTRRTSPSLQRSSQPLKRQSSSHTHRSPPSALVARVTGRPDPPRQLTARTPSLLRRRSRSLQKVQLITRVRHEPDGAPSVRGRSVAIATTR